MVCGTTSDSGKSTVVAGLCRLLSRQGVSVAPFKAQNMALNSAVTLSGHEIGRAQAAQARAAGVEPEVAMNPILLKPTDHRRSQVVVDGRPWATLDAADYQEAKHKLWPVVVDRLAELRRRFDVVLCEGAGSPAEINLFRHDIVNLRLAHHSGLPAVLVGDIDRGGVFASLFGTVALLPPEWRALVGGFVINKFRGDPAILGDGPAQLFRRTGVPTLGCIPWLDGVGLDAEDSLGLRRPWPSRPAGEGTLDVAVVALPRISNFTDLDALAVEPTVSLRLVTTAASLGRPDLVVLPGSKATLSDLAWLRATGLAAAISSLGALGASDILGICAGYQMLGRTVTDHVEASEPGCVAGLGLLDVDTEFDPVKVTRVVTGSALGRPVVGYEIHHGRTRTQAPWVAGPGLGPDGAGDGCRSAGGAVTGTSIHGLFEADGFRRAFLADVAAHRGRAWDPGPPVSFEAARQAQTDAVADALETHLDTGALYSLIEKAAT